MTRYWLPAILLATVGSVQFARAQSAPTLADRPIPGLRQGQIHNPFSPRYAPLIPHSYASRRTQTVTTPAVFENAAVAIPTQTWATVHDEYCYPLPIPQPPILYGFSPIVVPTDALYGPAAAARVLGAIPQPSAPLDNVWASPANPDPDWNQLPDEPQPPVKSHPERVARAQRSIHHGDEHFRHQRYGEAYRRYKQAAESAPDYADAYFRQAIALVALEQYGTACDTIRRGFEYDTDWASSPFRLDDVYGANRLAKQSHLEALAEAAEASPQDARLWYLLGVALYFDDQPQRAEPFFERAQQMVGHNLYLHTFLRALEPPAEPAHAQADEGKEL